MGILDFINDAPGLALAIIGGFIGFFTNFFLAKFSARSALKQSISEKRAEYYIELWQLCRWDLNTQKKQLERHGQLRKWYAQGGGLMLSFKATDRFVGAINLLQSAKEQPLNEDQLDELKENLSWLRTEMKYEVGAYSRKEAKEKLPNIKLKEEQEEEEQEVKEEQKEN